MAFHTILDKYEVLGSEAVAVTFANRIYGIVHLKILWNFNSCCNFKYLVSRYFFAGVDAQDALLKGLQDLKAVTAHTKKVFIQAVADSKLN